jgi:all-trans-8'-apo-beta-carotenal 15,15'-oxygenase
MGEISAAQSTRRVGHMKEVTVSRLNLSELLPNMGRRDLIRGLGALGACGLLDQKLLAQVFAPSTHISRLAEQPPNREGRWNARRIEGQVPRDLNGTLYRMTKGQLENHRVPLKHWFDGDAFLIKYSIFDASVTISARFIDTPERQQEATAGRMIYFEYGTAPPSMPAHYKNQPNINVILWDGRLLGLSEAFHPTAIDPETFAYQGRWDFYGTLPPNVSFTAHPKFDTDGAGYTFGTNNGIDWALMVYRMELNGTLTRVAKVPLPGYFMVHDMILGREHLVFVVPPVRYDFVALATGTVTAADALRYMDDNPTRFIVVRKDGTGEPVVIEQPPGMVYHHGNLAETGNVLSFDSLISPDGSVLELLDSWSEERWPRLRRNHLAQFSLDLSTRKVARSDVGVGNEFPRFDTRRVGTEARYLYALHEDPVDLFSFPEIIRFDFGTGRQQRVRSGRNRTLGEGVLVPRPGGTEEGDGWLLNQGYDAAADETFLEIRDAETLELTARVWTGAHLPLGFHGNFYSAG